MELQEWFMANRPDEALHYCVAAENQIMWVRDVMSYMIWNSVDSFDSSLITKGEHKETMIVESTHTSKSVLLPVYRFDFKRFDIKLRGNFHGWSMKYTGPELSELPKYIKKVIHEHGFYEGMETDRYDFKCEVSKKEQMYSLIWWLISEGIKSQ